MTNNIEQVKQALETSEVRFRTVNGIAKEIGLTYDEVLKILHDDDSGIDVVLISRRNTNSEALYTTKTRYKKESTWREKLCCAMNGKWC